MSKRNNQLKRIESVENESIRSDEVLTVAAFRKRMGIGGFIWRTLRKELPLRSVGRKLYITGEDWRAYVQGLPADWGDENGSGKLTARCHQKTEQEI